MARTHARVLVSIWADSDFTTLAGDEQRMYFLLLSQADLNLCGVLPYRPKRWARLGATDTISDVQNVIQRLSERGYLLVDEDTDELWIRSFIKYDGLLRTANMRKAMWGQFDQLLSQPIREGFQELYARLVSEGFTKPRGEGEGDGAGERLPAARKFVQRCPHCKLLEFDCHCDNVRELQREPFRDVG